MLWTTEMLLVVLTQHTPFSIVQSLLPGITVSVRAKIITSRESQDENVEMESCGRKYKEESDRGTQKIM